MYSILFGGDATVHIGGGTTEIVGHAHVYKDRPGEAFFHFEDQPHSTARVDVERNEQGRFSVTCSSAGSGGKRPGAGGIVRQLGQTGRQSGRLSGDHQSLPARDLLSDNRGT